MFKMIKNLKSGNDDKRRLKLATAPVTFIVAAVACSTIFVSTSSALQLPQGDLGSSPAEQIDADQAFRSPRDGFSFANYGGAPTNDAIDATVMAALDRKSTRLNSSHLRQSRMPSSA